MNAFKGYILNDKIASFSEWVFFLNWGSTHWANQTPMRWQGFEAFFMEDVPTIQFSD